jgi:hypothetical protein
MSDKKVAPDVLRRLKEALLTEATALRGGRRALSGSPLSSIPEVLPDVGRWRVLCYQQLLISQLDIEPKDAAGLAIELSRDELLVEHDPALVASDACRLLERWRQQSPHGRGRTGSSSD